MLAIRRAFLLLVVSGCAVSHQPRSTTAVRTAPECPSDDLVVEVINYTTLNAEVYQGEMVIASAPAGATTRIPMKRDAYVHGGTIRPVQQAPTSSSEPDPAVRAPSQAGRRSFEVSVKCLIPPQR